MDIEINTCRGFVDADFGLNGVENDCRRYILAISSARPPLKDRGTAGALTLGC
jgi:hypothetical protein